MIAEMVSDSGGRNLVRAWLSQLGSDWRFLFNLFYFVAIADVTSVDIGGGSIRLAWVLLPFLLFALPKRRHDKTSVLLVLLLFLSHLLAAFCSGSFKTGVVYSAWIIVSYVCFFHAGYVLSSVMRSKVWDAFLIGGRIQVVLGVLLCVLGFHERTRFIYYEPSYLAIGLVPYLFSVIFLSKRKLLDYCLLFSVIVTNQSANMMIAVFVALLFWLFCNRRFKVSAALLVLIPCLLYLAYWVALVDPDSPNHGIAEWVSENSLTVDFWVELLKRAGNRYPRFEAALEMIEGHWWLGLGPGGYATLTQGMNFDHISGGIAYFDPAGLPVINVLLEAVANAGVFPALVLVVCFVYLVFRISRVQDDMQRWTMMGALFAIGLMLQFESSYLRAYVWFAAGVFISRSRDKRNAAVVGAGERW